MNDFEQLLQGVDDERDELPLPSVAEQKAIAKKLKALEAAGNLTPEALEEVFAKYGEDEDKSTRIVKPDLSQINPL